MSRRYHTHILLPHYFTFVNLSNYRIEELFCSQPEPLQLDKISLSDIVEIELPCDIFPKDVNIQLKQHNCLMSIVYSLFKDIKLEDYPCNDVIGIINTWYDPSVVCDIARQHRDEYYSKLMGITDASCSMLSNLVKYETLRVVSRLMTLNAKLLNVKAAQHQGNNSNNSMLSSMVDLMLKPIKNGDFDPVPALIDVFEYLSNPSTVPVDKKNPFNCIANPRARGLVQVMRYMLATEQIMYAFIQTPVANMITNDVESFVVVRSLIENVLLVYTGHTSSKYRYLIYGRTDTSCAADQNEVFKLTYI